MLPTFNVGDTLRRFKEAVSGAQAVMAKNSFVSKKNVGASKKERSSRPPE
jgi:hypothetical protein